MDYKRKYKNIDFYRKQIDATCEHLDYYGSRRRTLIEHSRNMMYGYGSQAEELRDGDQDAIGVQALREAARHVYTCREHIRAAREAFRDKKAGSGSRISEAIQSSELLSQQEITACYPSLNFHTHCRMGTSAGYEKEKNPNGWGFHHNVYVPVTWKANVYDKDIAWVTGGDGKRFILNAKQRLNERLAEQDITSHSVYWLRKHGEDITMGNGWVLQYKTDQTTVNAFNIEHSKAESLLRRRIKDTAANVLLGL